MRSTIVSILFLFVILIHPCYTNPIPFVPITRNYNTTIYDAGTQNWSITQDKQGRMYFGNNKGLLEYDGHYWNLHPISTNGIIRSVYAADDDRIYVGSFEEFGYFERDETNKLIYHSLKPTVGDYSFHNDEIWTIFEVDNKLLFHSFGSYFIYDGKETQGYKMSRLPLNFFTIGETIYSQQIDGGVNAFRNGEFILTYQRELFNDDDIITGLPNKQGILLLTRNNGIFIHNGNLLSPWETDCDDEFKNNSINKAIITADSCYVIGTISNGVYCLDKNGRLLWKLNASNQLANNTVLGLYCDMENNIWIALDNGIAYIQNNSHIFQYEPQDRKIGMVYDVLVDNQQAYIASNQGLYRMNQSTNKLEMIPDMGEQAWTIGKWGNQIVCGHNKGTFRISGNQAILMSDAKGAMCVAEGKIDNEEILIQGTYALPNIYKKDKRGEWYYSNLVDAFSHMAKNIEIDHRGNIWVEHLRRGIYRFRLNSGLNEAIDIRFYKSLGNNNPRNKYYLFNINGRVAFSDNDSFYTYDDIKDTIIPYALMNEQLAGITGIHSVNKHRKNQYWFLSDKEAYLIECGLTEFDILMKIPFSIFKNPPIEEKAKIIYDKADNCSYLCLNNSIAKIIYDNVTESTTNNNRELLLTEFKAINEKANEHIYYPLKEDNKIKPGYNNIEIKLSYPEYSGIEVNVRYKLEGLSDIWMEEKSQFKKTYTRLPFGNYRFYAEIYNEKEVISSIYLPFQISRPWYLSHIAISIYVLSFLFILSMLLYGVYLYTKRKKDKVIESQRIAHEAQIREQEKKIVELERDRLEADLKFKSKELSGVVMTNIAHQEFLMAIKSEIQQQKLSGQYTRRNLDKLLSMLNQNMVSDEENWNMFQANFDRIHENFFRNLKEQYPELTSGDLRLCGFLRLNLPTKDISKLMNISIRGVDAARYRLRKKLELPQDSSLTDFMINFK